MNSVEIFYQIFRLRYNMEDIKKSFAGRYSICLMGCYEDCVRMREWMGEFSLSSGIHPEKNLCLASIPESEEEGNMYRNMDAIVCHLGAEFWSFEDMADLVECMPTGVPILYVCEPLTWEGEPEAYLAAKLPNVVPLRAGHEDKHFANLLFKNFPRIGMRLARDYQNLRDICIDSLISSASGRMAVVAAASSVSVNVPVLGHLLSIMASPVETLAITAEQLRLVIYIGALYGRPLDFFDRIDELWMVIGGSWGWRTLAREFVGLIPGAGFMAKAGVAWMGTFTVGELSRRFYELGEKVPNNIRQIVVNSAKRRVKRASKMKFKLDEGALAVENMLNCASSSEQDGDCRDDGIDLAKKDPQIAEVEKDNAPKDGDLKNSGYGENKCASLLGVEDKNI